MLEFEDQMGKVIALPHLPKRIVSLVPSQTDLLYYLGLKNRIVGQTLFCIKPESEFKKSIKVGGTKKLNLDKIRDLKPDLIIGNKEENDKSRIEELQNEFPVWMSDINTIEEALDMIVKLGVVTGRGEKAIKLEHNIRKGLGQLKPVNKTALYLIWQEPFMAVGNNTFINDVMEHAGITNILGTKESRYPELNLDTIKDLNPDMLLLSSEPFPFKEKHKEELQKALPNMEIKLVDGEVFSWYGNKMVDIKGYFDEF
jgi:ABC-type Fe3+-hydroxamate transport system substrate-binding protein